MNILATVAIRTIRPIYVSRLVLHREPDLARGRLRDRQRDLAARATSGARPSGALSNSLSDAILNWWYAHNLFGLWLTPMLIALTYYIVPRITNTPLYSYTLSLDQLLGDGVLLHGRGRPPHPAVADAGLAEDDRRGLLRGCC